MKRAILSIFLLSAGLILHAQSPLVSYEKKDGGYILYGNNEELYPVSVSLDLNITNLDFSEGEKKIFVLPSKTQKYKIGELTMTDRSKTYKFSYKFQSAIGDVTITDYDKAFLYDLPFQKGKSYKLFQGYNGNTSHQNENALDFTMPEGSEVLAAREGVVVKVVKNNTASCPEKDCSKYNNYIRVMHPDGTFADYLHIKYNGTDLNPGDRVKKGDVIAYSGNVGWSSGPHLHFVCFLGGFGKSNSLETKFRIDNGTEAAKLKEGIIYSREY